MSSPVAWGTLYESPAIQVTLNDTQYEQEFPANPVDTTNVIYVLWNGQSYMLADRGYLLTVDQESLAGTLTPAFSFGGVSGSPVKALAACAVGGAMYIVVSSEDGIQIWRYTGGSAAVMEVDLGLLAIGMQYNIFHDGTFPYIVYGDPTDNGASVGWQRNGGTWDLALTGLPDNGHGAFIPAAGFVSVGNAGYIVGSVAVDMGPEVLQAHVVKVAAGVVTAYTDAAWISAIGGASPDEVAVGGIVRYGTRLCFFANFGSPPTLPGCQLWTAFFSNLAAWSETADVFTLAGGHLQNNFSVPVRVVAVSWRRKIWALLNRTASSTGFALFTCEEGDLADWSLTLDGVSENRALFLLQ